MLGKQWLHRYASIDVRGSAVERNHHRQRKLDGLITWCFGYVMKSIPLMLQGALLLFSCALFSYLWDINTTTASVVFGIVSFGALFHLFVLIAGATSSSCPYQTPGSHILLWAIKVVSRLPQALITLRANVVVCDPRQCKGDIKRFVKDFGSGTPSALAAGAFHLGQEAGRFFIDFVCRMYGRLSSWSPTPDQGPEQESTMLDLRCISWMLQMSPDEAAHLATMEYLASMQKLDDFDPALVIFCFNILMGCVNVVNGRAVVARGSEQLAKISALCLLRTLSHLSVTDPMSDDLADLRQRYNKAFPSCTDFGNLPFHHIFRVIHFVFYPGGKHQRLGWEDYKPSGPERVIVAQALAKLAQSEYRRSGRRMEVPRWILCFALNSLSLDPPPPVSIIVDSLLTIAIDLGCDVSCARNPSLGEKYVHI